MSEKNSEKEGRTEVDLEDSRYSDGKVTPNTRFGVDDQGPFLYEEDGAYFTRTGETSNRRRSPDERPEDPISVGFDGPTDLTIYHETNWLRRVTVRKRTVEVAERHYPPIREHLPLRLLLQYLLFNRHSIKLDTTWDGERPPLPGTMLSWMAGRLNQYLSGNFRAEDMLWWAKDELFEGDFRWTEWKRHPDPQKRHCRQVKEVSIAAEVAEVAKWEREHPVSQVSERVWFDTGTAYTSQSASDLRTGTRRLVRNHGAEVFTKKGNPEIPRTIQTYLNGLPVDGFSKIILDHIEEAYEVVDRLSQTSPEGDLDPGVRHARATLRAMEDCPQPFYEAKLNTPRLYASGSLQLLNREVRATLVQDWIPLDLKSAQLAVCSHLWDVGPLLEFLRGGGDIWQELIGWMDLPKSALKKALYAITFGARAHWTYGNPPSTLINALAEEAEISIENAEEARRHLMDHPLMKSLHEAQQRRIEEIEQQGYVKDCFGTGMDLASGSTQNDNVEAGVLTLLAAEASAFEMRLLWPAFEEVIGKEKRCKIMLYAFDGFYIKPSDPGRGDLWTRKLQSAVDQQAENLGIPTVLERED